MVVVFEHLTGEQLFLRFLLPLLVPVCSLWAGLLVFSPPPNGTSLAEKLVPAQGAQALPMQPPVTTSAGWWSFSRTLDAATQKANITGLKANLGQVEWSNGRTFIVGTEKIQVLFL